MADFQIGGVAYQSRSFDGETQVLVAKRLLPALTALVGCSVSDGAEDAPDPDQLRDMLLPAARELASLKDSDVKFVLDACLDVTKRQAAGGGVGWVPIRQNGVVQDANDASFQTRLTVAWHVLGENFSEMISSMGLNPMAMSKIVTAAA